MNVLFVFGTRPEAIKLAPLILHFKEQAGPHSVSVCITSQHKSMLEQVLEFFQIGVDHDLDLMRPDQSLDHIASQAIFRLGQLFREVKPDLIFVQGDTTTVMAAAIAAFHQQIPVAHVEAGLRTFEKYSPFPEEINRILVSHIADYHFAPTEKAKNNLIKEGITEDRIWVVGNTVIDALLMTVEKVRGKEEYYRRYFAENGIDFCKKIILVTGHRRENFGPGLRSICTALKEIGDKDVDVVYPVHLNPNVRGPVMEILDRHPNIHLMNPLPYDKLVFLMERSYLILTDSGGIQEEAPSLGKPVLVMRDVTERPEGIEAGTARLVGTDRSSILEHTFRLLNDPALYDEVSRKQNPYGDGKSSEGIYRIISHLSI